MKLVCRVEEWVLMSFSCLTWRREKEPGGRVSWKFKESSALGRKGQPKRAGEGGAVAGLAGGQGGQGRHGPETLGRKSETAKQ